MRKHIISEINRCAGEIRKICSDARIIVFGSSIDDKVENPRDIDLLVAVPESVHFKQILRRVLAIPRTTWPLDILVVPTEFLEERIRATGNFYFFAVSEGIEIGQNQKIPA